MNELIALLKQSWPWYIAGPLIGLTVLALLLLGNKPFGISANLRHLCAACVPAKIPFFQYNWQKESWNLFFAGGILIGGFIAALALGTNEPIHINENLRTELANYGITNLNSPVPIDLFNWANLFTLPGFLIMIGGGFLVGFGARYAGGCTSGHAIMGIATWQRPSVIATCCFMAGGFIMTHLILPII